MNDVKEIKEWPIFTAVPFYFPEKWQSAFVLPIKFIYNR
jgi:hypothetical protein